MVPSNLKVLAKFGLCSTRLAKLDECSLARARKIVASARKLGFSSVKISYHVAYKSIICILKTKTDTENNVPVRETTENIGETCPRHECFWKNDSHFVDVY